MSDTETNFSVDRSDGAASEEFADANEQLFLEDLEEARLAEHAVAIREYVAAAELDTRGTELDSDEERSIIGRIREEITRQVRQEMAAEGSGDGATAAAGPNEENAVDGGEFLSSLDPRLREELERMRKLDKVLLRKMRREREVKRSRLEQERRFREELRVLDESSGRESSSKMSKDVRNNMLKFMALKPPPKHNAGVYSEDSPPPTPVFQTEYLGERASAAASSTTEPEASGASCAPSGSETAGKRRSSGAAQAQKGKPDKDFIKRNIELAGMASEVVAMTEDERSRLDSLLCDLDALPTSFESPEHASDFSNPFKVAVKPGEGFSLDQNTRLRMDEIDARLSQLMPASDLESLATPSADSDSMSYQPSLQLRMQLEPNFDFDQLGEEALREVKASRDLKQRLESIDGGLEDLRVAHEEEVPSPQLNPLQLEELLDQCVRSFSRSTVTRTPSLTQRSEAITEADSAADTERTERSELEEWLENPPHLEREVLMQLLEESRMAGIGTAYLPALPEAPESESETETLQNGDSSRTSISNFTDESQTSRRLTSRASIANEEAESASPSRRSSAGWPQLANSRAAAEHPTGTKEERLVLPDINMFAHMTAPKRPT